MTVKLLTGITVNIPPGIADPTHCLVIQRPGVYRSWRDICGTWNVINGKLDLVEITFNCICIVINANSLH